jgi:hypothetical protein
VPKSTRAPAHGQHEKERVVHDRREPAGGRQQCEVEVWGGRVYPTPMPTGGICTGAHSAVSAVPPTLAAVHTAITRYSAANARTSSHRALCVPP